MKNTNLKYFVKLFDSHIKNYKMSELILYISLKIVLI